MQIKELHVQRFRGFSEIKIRPRGNVVLMGEPGAGRTDLFEALSRLLNFYQGRNREISELDFHLGDCSEPIRISVTLGDLDIDLEQDFFDHLELWDETDRCLIDEAQNGQLDDRADCSWAFRITYEARWLQDEAMPEDRVFFPKDSDPESGIFARVRRNDLEALGFGLLRPGSTGMLELGPRSDFRKLVDVANGDDFGAAMRKYVNEVGIAAENFSHSDQVQAAVARIVALTGELQGIPNIDPSTFIQFAPDDGSESGLLRSLGAAVDFDDGVGQLPAWRHGSSTRSLLKVAEVVAAAKSPKPVLVIDDLGDGMDAPSAAHLAAALCETASQVWVTTRIPAVAEVFQPQEVLRLGKGKAGKRTLHSGTHAIKPEEAAMYKHWHRNLLPALTYRSVIIVEGPHDFVALHTLALRLHEERGTALPATHKIAIVSAGASGDGGYATVMKLARQAKSMGLFAVGAVDGDSDPASLKYIETNLEMADSVVRLPRRFAIEKALVHDIPDSVLMSVVQDLENAVNMENTNVQPSDGGDIHKKAMALLKKESLHGPFIDLLPAEHLPPLACRYLGTLVGAARGDSAGLIQLCKSTT